MEDIILLSAILAVGFGLYYAYIVYAKLKKIEEASIYSAKFLKELVDLKKKEHKPH
jgi:hypothetical protein